MNKIIYRQIMSLEDVTLSEAKEIWQEEVEAQNGDIFEALTQFGLEPDMVV